jgi:hypothetical protein
MIQAADRSSNSAFRDDTSTEPSRCNASMRAFEKDLNMRPRRFSELLAAACRGELRRIFDYATRRRVVRHTAIYRAIRARMMA